MAIVLDESEEFLAKHNELVQHFRAGELPATRFIATLLDEQNTVKTTKLEKDALSQRQGMVVAELCDRFYAHPKYSPVKPWPGSPAKKQLRDFLEQHGVKPSVADTMELAQSLGLDHDFPY